MEMLYRGGKIRLGERWISQPPYMKEIREVEQVSSRTQLNLNVLRAYFGIEWIDSLQYCVESRKGFLFLGLSGKSHEHVTYFRKETFSRAAGQTLLYFGHSPKPIRVNHLFEGNKETITHVSEHVDVDERFFSFLKYTQDLPRFKVNSRSIEGTKFYLRSGSISVGRRGDPISCLFMFDKQPQLRVSRLSNISVCVKGADIEFYKFPSLIRFLLEDSFVKACAHLTPYMVKPFIEERGMKYLQKVRGVKPFELVEELERYVTHCDFSGDLVVPWEGRALHIPICSDTRLSIPMEFTLRKRGGSAVLRVVLEPILDESECVSFSFLGLPAVLNLKFHQDLLPLKGEVRKFFVTYLLKC